MVRMKRLNVAVAFAVIFQPCVAYKECTFQGNILPLLGEDEMEWPNVLRLILYLLGLAWLFVAVGLISDIFMGGIERVTSWRKCIREAIPGTDPVEYRQKTVYIWNATIANLTLMALGSSAPEILLSLIEIVFGDFLLGDLGAGTIVGSAAFNLLIISAVCVAALPDGEIRKINQTPVYIITAFFSVFAYLWLLIIVFLSSPEVVTAVEALITVIFLPILLVLAYLADRGKITFGIKVDNKEEQAIDENVTPEELAKVHAEIKERHGPNLTNEQVACFMEVYYLSRRNKAYYRNNAKKKKNQETNPGSNKVGKVGDVEDCVKEDKQRTPVLMGFESENYAVLESEGKLAIKIIREGCVEARASVFYETRGDTATSGMDFTATKGTLIFDKGETEKTIEIEIKDDTGHETNEDFFVDLKNPQILPGSEHTASAMVQASLKNKVAQVTIIDDDLPGKLRFTSETLEAIEDADKDCTFEVTVERFEGSTGTVGCKYYTQQKNAVDGVDYDETNGTLTFEEKVMTQKIPITIKHSGRYKEKASFFVTLHEPFGKAKFDEKTDGGEESCTTLVTIKGYESEERDKTLAKMRSKVIATKAANRAYMQQFVDAVMKVKDDDDDDEEGQEEGTDLKKEEDKPTPLDWFFHIISVPWKVLFACVPPPHYLGGWLTFFGALCVIGIITALVGDMANLVGCCMGLDAEITAITFVALGTSLPDTFASKAAAEMDPYADNSIGNVTGSNSVNVFIGLGLSWSVAALYWETHAVNDKWTEKFDTYGADVQTKIAEALGKTVAEARVSDKAIFMVPSGSLWFNLMVFSVNAFFAIQHLAARRKKFSGELGGPKGGFMGQYFSAAFLSAQWFIYVIASTIYVYANKD